MRFLLAALLLYPTAGFAQSYPFVGRWDCKVATFTFTARTYHNGSKTLPVRSVEDGGGGDFLLGLADGSRITLLGVSRTRMTWHSPISGDTFECSRLRS